MTVQRYDRHDHVSENRLPALMGTVHTIYTIYTHMSLGQQQEVGEHVEDLAGWLVNGHHHSLARLLCELFQQLHQGQGRAGVQT